MEGLLSMTEGSSKSNAIRSVKEIDHNTMQEFLDKLAIWGFYQMSKDEFASKSDLDKEKLIIKYYNECISGIILLFVDLLSECLASTVSDTLVSSMTSSSPVRFRFDK